MGICFDDGIITLCTCFVLYFSPRHLSESAMLSQHVSQDPENKILHLCRLLLATIFCTRAGVRHAGISDSVIRRGA